jgi:hypothetical protein
MSSVVASRQRLFEQEVGAYLAAVSPSNRVGVCKKCLAIRFPTEVDGRECCPASLVEVGLEHADRAETHDWEAFTERAALEQFVGEHMRGGTFQSLLEQVGKLADV